MAEFLFHPRQEKTLSLVCYNGKGEPTTPKTPPVWSIDTTEVFALWPLPDGMSAIVQALGPIGTTTVTAKVDGSFDTNVVELSMDKTLVVVPRPIETLEMVESLPREMDPPPEPPSQ